MRANIALTLALALAAVLLAAAPTPARALDAAATPAGSVTFIAGTAERVAGPKTERLAPGSPVWEGDALVTERRSRLEVKLSDGSVLRLGPASRAQLSTARFGKGPEDRQVSARLLVGTVWAHVAKAVGGRARFEVQTDSAVAGVRGTTFRVDAAKDRSVVVRVYSGAVAVAGGSVPRPAHAVDAAERRQVPGPQEVSREQWERIVTTMMEVRVSADGVPAEPEPFQLGGGDDWERWNRQRDADPR